MNDQTSIAPAATKLASQVLIDGQAEQIRLFHILFAALRIDPATGLPLAQVPSVVAEEVIETKTKSRVEEYFRIKEFKNYVEAKAIATACLRLAGVSEKLLNDAATRFILFEQFDRVHPDFRDYMSGPRCKYVNDKQYPSNRLRAIEFIAMKLGRIEGYREFLEAFDTMVEAYPGDAAVRARQMFLDDPDFAPQHWTPVPLLMHAFDQFTIGGSTKLEIPESYPVRGWGVLQATGEVA